MCVFSLLCLVLTRKRLLSCAPVLASVSKDEEKNYSFPIYLFGSDIIDHWNENSFKRNRTLNLITMNEMEWTNNSI